MIQFDIISIFPKIFSAKGGSQPKADAPLEHASGGDSCCYFDYGITGRAIKKKLIKINIHDLRKHTKGVHKSVDDRPYGGGPGMILSVEPIYKALRAIRKKRKKRIIMLAPEGKEFTQKEAKRFSKYNNRCI